MRAPRPLTRRAAAAGLAGVLLLGACSSSGTTSSPTTTSPTTTTSSSGGTSTSTTGPTTSGATTTTSPTTTTTDVATVAHRYEADGPHPVGVTTLHLADATAVEVWYPAPDGTKGTDTYDARDFVPPAIKALLTGHADSTHTEHASRDAAVADGTFPVVLFSHGFAGFRLQSTFLTTHLASWGMIVVAPDHPSRDLDHVLGDTPPSKPQGSVKDLLDSLDLILAQNADATSRFHGHVETARVAAVGHSAGGGTVLAAASDPRIGAYVSLASGAFPASAPGSTTTTAVPLPEKPSLFIGGTLDAVVPLKTVTEPAYRAAPGPSTLWAITGAGHNAFDDFCTFGNGTGIIGVAEASGLGPVLEKQPSLVKLGSDGCVKPAVPVATTYPIIDQAVTSFLLSVFGADPDNGAGFGPAMAGQFAVKVAISQK